MVGRTARFTEPNENVGSANELLRPLYADRFDFVGRLSKPGGIG